MNSTALSTKGIKVAVSALLAAAAFMALGLALGAGSAKASTPGGSISPDFNYVGLTVGTSVAGDIDTIVLEPPATAIGINGTYKDTEGNFTIPKSGGLDFPPVVVDLDLVQINGEIALNEDGVGQYNEATGEMSMDLSLSLTLGVDDLEALSQEIGMPLGTGKLACKLAPLNVTLATGKGWPHPGKPFADKTGLTDGAVAGAWRSKPPITATEGDQSVCNIIGGILQPVGGIWLANSTTPVGTMPAATDTKPTVYTCEEDGLVGNPPNCEEPPTAANFSKVAVTPAKGKIKAGKKATVTVKVTNTGGSSGTATIKVTSSNKKVTAPKTVKVAVPAGKTVSKKITVKAAKTAKGKATITVKVGSKSAKSKLTVK